MKVDDNSTMVAYATELTIIASLTITSYLPQVESCRLLATFSLIADGATDSRLVLNRRAHPVAGVTHASIFFSNAICPA